MLLALSDDFHHQQDSADADTYPKIQQYFHTQAVNDILTSAQGLNS
jgi:hypothetical protein